MRALERAPFTVYHDNDDNDGNEKHKNQPQRRFYAVNPLKGVGAARLDREPLAAV